MLKAGNKAKRTAGLFRAAGFIAVLLAVLAVPAVICAQDAGDEHFYWLNFGAGPGTGAASDGSAGMSPGICISYLAGTHLFSLRYAHGYEVKILGPSPQEQVLDIGLLYGFINRSDIGYASISAGLAGVGGTKRVEEAPGIYKGAEFFTAGVALEAQLFWTPLPFVGLGLAAFADINPERTFAGLLFCVQAGKLPVPNKKGE